MGKSLSALPVPELATPATPAAGNVIVYLKSDGLLYVKNSAGTETPLNAASSTTIVGLVELATNTETTTGTDAVRATTPAGVKAAIDARTASASAQGIIEIATLAESLAGTDTSRAVTPSSLMQAMATRTLNVQTGTTYTLAIADQIKIVEMTHASSAQTLTIPPNSTVPFTVGTLIPIYRGGAGGSLTIAAGAGVTLHYVPGNKVADQWGGAELYQKAIDEWILWGRLSV